MTKIKLVALLLASATMSASGGTQKPNPCKHALDDKAIQTTTKQDKPVRQEGPNDGTTVQYSSETLKDRYLQLQDMASHDKSIQIIDMSHIKSMVADCSGDDIASSH